ncbi:organic cation transporter protein-like [Trichoplusia ni]|uniref:Organic cation transporter protein-like n=1 Tax=Trichoplusia ni TaxID=7111 RepID=A0A7E5VW19_TRINI|nr:organic cation transporter protein-like [Trichoplusia ni]
MFNKTKMSVRKDEQKYVDISKITEPFGRYQIIQYILICLPTICVCMVSINYVFVAGDVNYRCRVDECEGIDPNSTEFYPSWWPNTTTDRCSKPVARDSACGNDSFTGAQETCTEWVYETDNTVIAELNLACQPWKSNLIGTIHSTGMLVSMLISGWMSDRFGRKPTLIICVVFGTIGNLKTLAKTYYVYVLIEFLEATFTGGSYASAMVILLEISSAKYRLLSGVIFAYAIYVGESLFACIAMFVPNWKTLIRIINGPLIFFISYIFFIYESPRWQIVSGRIDKAKESLKRIAETNKINIDYKELDEMSDVKLKAKFDVEEVQIKEGYKAIFSSKVILKRLFVASTTRFTSSFVYYGLMLNSVWLPGDKYVNFLLSTVMSFPGELICLYMMNRFGRKAPLVVGFIMCGAVCIICAFIPDVYTWAKISLFLLGKVVIAACFTGAITYAMELFPTSVRGTLIGLGAFASRIGGMLAPLTPILNTVSTILPPLFFGGCAVLAGLAICLTPETKGMPLLDTIKQVEDSERKCDVDSSDPRGNTTCSMETVVSKI